MLCSFSKTLLLFVILRSLIFASPDPIIINRDFSDVIPSRGVIKKAPFPVIQLGTMITQPQSSEWNREVVFRSIRDVLPLAIAVIPWGVLAGSLAIETGLTPLQAQCMSLLVFAGAVQLASLNLIQLLSPWIAIFSTTFVISSRHLLYSAVYRQEALKLPRFKRYLLAFILTDEMFVVSENYRKETGAFSYAYAVTAGVVFYVVWNLASCAGIFLGEALGNTDDLGFEFAVAAIFIVMVMPGVTNLPVLGAVLVSAVVAVVSELQGLTYGILLAGLSGMLTGFLLEKWQDKRS